MFSPKFNSEREKPLLHYSWKSHTLLIVLPGKTSNDIINLQTVFKTWGQLFHKQHIIEKLTKWTAGWKANISQNNSILWCHAKPRCKSGKVTYGFNCYSKVLFMHCAVQHAPQNCYTKSFFFKNKKECIGDTKGKLNRPMHLCQCCHPG